MKSLWRSDTKRRLPSITFCFLLLLLPAVVSAREGVFLLCYIPVFLIAAGIPAGLVYFLPSPPPLELPPYSQMMPEYYVEYRLEDENGATLDETKVLSDEPWSYPEVASLKKEMIVEMPEVPQQLNISLVPDKLVVISSEQKMNKIKKSVTPTFETLYVRKSHKQALVKKYYKPLISTCYGILEHDQLNRKSYDQCTDFMSEVVKNKKGKKTLLSQFSSDHLNAAFAGQGQFVLPSFSILQGGKMVQNEWRYYKLTESTGSEEQFTLVPLE